MAKVNLGVDTDKAAFRTAYNQAITGLTTIQTTDLDTNAKLQQAVKGLAGMLEKTLKALKRRI